MSSGETQPTHSLSGHLGNSYPRSHSGSEDRQTLDQDDNSLASRPTHSRAYLSIFEGDSTDENVEMSSTTSSVLLDQVPALTRGSSVASSGCSAMQTDCASAVQNGCVLESDDGILTLPLSHDEPDADLLCPFQILDCDLIFSSIRHFKMHVFSHFRGHPLPSTALCFLCERRYDQTSEDDPALAWNNMLSHMAHEHFRRGQELGTIRADFALMRWLYDRKIISDHQYKNSQLCPEPTLLPAAASRRFSQTSQMSQMYASTISIPEAPSPPLISTPTSIASESSVVTRRLSAYGDRPYFTFAGARAERRRRDSTRPILRHAATIS